MCCTNLWEFEQDASGLDQLTAAHPELLLVVRGQAMDGGRAAPELLRRYLTVVQRQLDAGI